MAKIKVGIVEDEMLIAEGIIQALGQYGYETTEPALSYTEALAMIEKDHPDILLLDIQLSGKKDGIELAAKIKEEYNIPFIFLTANSDTATLERAKQLHPPAYLVKPFNKDELYTSIEVCLHNFSAAQSKQQAPADKDNYHINDYLFVKQGNYFHKVRIDDILYMESDNVYINVYTTQQKFLVRSTIQAYLELIDSKQFLRVHRSFAVNTGHIDTINSESIFIRETEIPISKVYRDQLLSLFRLG